MQVEFTNPKLMRKSAKFANFPIHQMPEIAIIGKSNVGKSSFVNHFLKTPNLTMTSSKPGRTRQFFFFNIHNKIVLVDLPGYGWASVSKTMKADWNQTMVEYLKFREELQLVLFLVDIRRVPDENDFKMFDLILDRELPMILLFTKMDKPKKNEIAKNKKKIFEAFDLHTCMNVSYSVHSNKGRPELSKLINQAFSEE
ncbi:MAG: YihA family ribosome biogenesis GTP-binding protein [Planctomycetota bacterium]|nr:MAG: YihA family ribosome biogenesis GTP-binding protein [Planctomycetota bacterium]